MNLAEQALKYYWEYMKYYPEYDSWLILHQDKVYFRVSKIVRFCRLTNPRIFTFLDRYELSEVFPNTKQFKNPDSQLTYHWITLDKFKEIICEENYLSALSQWES